ncbi:MAG: hypothetical protein RL638_500 [Bacteroidota bacterium]|jgi:hypothetical protein
MNPNFNEFKRIITTPILFKFFILKNLSAAFWAGLNIHQFDKDSCVVRTKLSWFNQNPFRSMYFAVEAMAAEMSSGMLAYAQVHNRKPAVSMLVEKVEATFVKKATGTIYFTCEDGAAMESAVDETVRTGEGVKLLSKSVGKNEEGVIVAEFTFIWSFKAKSI